MLASIWTLERNSCIKIVKCYLRLFSAAFRFYFLHILNMNSVEVLLIPAPFYLTDSSSTKSRVHRLFIRISAKEAKQIETFNAKDNREEKNISRDNNKSH